MKDKNIATLFVIVTIIGHLILGSMLFYFSQRGQSQRLKNREQVLVTQREALSIKCLLLIPNDERTQSNIDRCDAEAKLGVEKESK